MNMDKFSESGIQVLRDAQSIAIKYGNIELDELHLHLAIIKLNNPFIDSIFKDMSIESIQYIKDLEAYIDKLDKKDALTKLYYNRISQKILLVAEDISRNMYEGQINAEHIFLAILKENKITSQSIFEKYNISYNEFYNLILKQKNTIKVSGNQSERISKVLYRFGRDLTLEAKKGLLDPVIGRDEEISRMIRILSRRTKNNPVIIGEPGVGKTALVEGLAQRIIHNDIPDTLKDKSIFSLDMGALIAGAKFRGQFEERLKDVLNIIKESNGQIILYIDELHTVVGAGDKAGGLDTSNMLKPLLARGEILTIGSTTYEEYKKYIEKDGALDRRFQKIIIDEPNVEQTISILRGIKSKYEMYHGIRVSDKAIIACATLSDRYISDRYLPDKAIDLMDEASSMVRTSVDRLPTEIDELQRKLLQYEMEKTSIRQDTDEISQLRLHELENKITKIKQHFDIEYNKWLDDKKIIQRTKDIKQQINEVNILIDKATRENNFEKVSELRLVRLVELENEEKILNNTKHYYKIKEEVTEDDISEVVSKWTNIPVSKLNENEKDKILNLNCILSKEVIGQDEAINSICNSIIRMKSGVKKAQKPIGTFMFIGSTGVGKTQLAKSLATVLFDDKNNLIRLDMSEYMEKHSVSKLVGAPPGYVGYEEGGILTEAVRRRPYSVILFDEIEKANDEVFNLLLQVLDEGRLTDNKGRTIDFKNTIIIMTTNIGIDKLIIEKDKHNNLCSNNPKDLIMKEMKSFFKPEFINRLDDIILFRQLDKNDIAKIINIELEKINNNLNNKIITLSFDTSCINYIVDNSFSHQFGARPVIRFIEQEIVTEIGRQLLCDKIKEKNNVTIKYNGKLIYEIQ